MKAKSKKQPIVKFLLRLSVAILIFGGIFLLAFRSCTKGYNDYAIFIHVKDESIFLKQISPSDPRIIDQGRKLKNDVAAMDQKVDNGDGSNTGKLRWYICQGIDCDEGWETSFLPMK